MNGLQSGKEVSIGHVPVLRLALYILCALFVTTGANAQGIDGGSRISLKSRLPLELKRYQDQLNTESRSQVVDAIPRSGFRMPVTTERKSNDDAVDGLWAKFNPQFPVPNNAEWRARKSVIAECNSAIEALDAYELSIFDRKAAAFKVQRVDELRDPYLVSSVWDMSDQTDRDEYAKYVKLISNYDGNCVRDPADDPAWKAAGLDSIVGVLSVSSPGIAERKFCTAFRISNTRVATARHCSYAVIEVGGAAVFSAGRVLFDLPLANKKVKVRGPICARKQLPDGLVQPCAATYEIADADAARGAPPEFSEDWDFLDIDDPGIPFPSTVDVGTAMSVSDNLVVGGLMLYAGFLSPAPKHDSWLRVSRTGYCKIVEVTKDCATYGCQTIGGTSGAPLIVMEESNRVAIRGIHVGSTDDDGVQKNASCSARKMMIGSRVHGNVGMVFSSFVGPFAH